MEFLISIMRSSQSSNSGFFFFIAKNLTMIDIHGSG